MKCLVLLWEEERGPRGSRRNAAYRGRGRASCSADVGVCSGSGAPICYGHVSDFMSLDDGRRETIRVRASLTFLAA